MLARINEYRGVIIFYLLLLILLFAMSYQAKITDMQSNNIININNN